MTTLDDRTGTSVTAADNASGHARLTDVSALDPWTSLRPATGMLLGLEDFQVLVDHPRAKQLLHDAWWHGPGVLHGLRVRSHGLLELEICPGLAVDAVGRELHLDTAVCCSMEALIPRGRDRTLTLWVVLRYDACTARSVTVLADACDVTRSSTEDTRVLERARVELLAVRPQPRPTTYRRVRMLLGLEPVPPDPAHPVGADVGAWRDLVTKAAPADRAAALLNAFRCLAAEDCADLTAPGRDCTGDQLPTDGAGSGVVLACVTYAIEYEGDAPVIRAEPVIDLCCRTVVLPTGVIQDLVCGLAPALLGTDAPVVAAAPQVRPDSLEWDEAAEAFAFEVTADVVPASLKRAVHVSSLSEHEWVVEDLAGPPRYDPARRRVLVRLADRPVNPLVRVLVLGTGRTPVYGADPPVPLAGVVGEDPGTLGQGRDAVLTVANPLLGERAEAQTPDDVPTGTEGS
ncbi:hypothetical protein ACWFNE_06795 [Cellulomonas sp. NPDC055163]